ncbi:MAG: geranylgeranyl reductase family protein [Deltaproteobacteria bacterium]|nr:geranylgeranyl reductase family protein [Deltaproteobacteria bacterium]
MYKVGIIGAGIGGSYLSYRLSKEGIDTIVFDFRAPHEKLCGGGISYKAMVKFPLLNELDCPRKVVWKSTFISPKERVVTIDLERPLTIFNRMDLDYSLLKKAMESGARFRKEKVQSFAREGNSWRIFTNTGDYKAEILVGADGALSRTRRKLNVLSVKEDAFFALQCFLDVQTDFVTYKFFPDLEGYLWAFPRVDSLAIGIVSKVCRGRNFKDMKERLLRFIQRYYPGMSKTISVRGAYIPFFSAKYLQDVSICSRNWALIGDAASFAEPISGEGIYYAIYSAEILAGCILKNDLSLYQQLCMKHFGENLVKAGQTFEYFYQAELIETMVVLAEKSKPIREILSEMIAGNINYLSWKSRFRKDFLKILANFIFNTDITTKQEIVTNLVKLSPKYYRFFSRNKIS